MSLDTRVEQHHAFTFDANMQLAMQQRMSKLRPFVSEKPCKGSAQPAANIIGEGNYNRRTGRRRSNSENPPDRSRRWLVRTDPIESGQYLDEEDKWDMLDDPTSELYSYHAATIQRGVDDIILGIDLDGKITGNGLLGSANEGKTPGNEVGLPASQIMVHGGTGLTLEKLIKVREQFGLDEAALETISPCMAITARQHSDLLRIISATAASLNQFEQPQMVEGKVARLLGINFVEIQRLPKVGSVRKNPTWLKDKVKLGVFMDVRSRAWNDGHAGNTPYTMVDAVMDCARTEDKGTIIVENAEA